MNSRNFFIIIAIYSMGFWGCKAPSTVITHKPMATLPSQYLSPTVGESSANSSWRIFFKDSLLIALIDTALNQNLDLLKIQQRLEIADAQILRAGGQLRPYFNGVANVGLRRFGKYTMDGVGNFDTNFSNNISDSQRLPEYLPDFQWGLQSSWEIDIYKKLRNRRQAAVARYMATVEGRNLVVTNIIADVANLYYDLIATDLELDFVRETLNLQRNQLEIIKLEKQTGRSTELAVQQFEAQLLNTQTLEKELLQRIILDENRLNYILGRFPQPIQRTRNNFLRGSPLEVLIGLPSELLLYRPDIRQAEQELIAAKADVLAARAAFLPALNLGGFVGFQAFNPKFILNPSSIALNILGGISAPLFNKTAIQADFNVSKATQLEALYQYHQNIVNAVAEVHNLATNINTLQQVYTLKTDEARKWLSAVESASQLYQTGRANYLEILINRQNAISANLDLIEIKQRQYETAVGLYRALGGGWR